jgi:demethylmenaquinone methyltransferase/2-methoxy-6-polyprenyl-1,4-benzoquinol methylase
MPRATLDKDPRAVAAMFDAVARRYDVTNDVISLGQDRYWRRATLAAVGAQRGEQVLDLAAGTGTSSEPLADAGVRVVPCDLSFGMLEVVDTAGALAELLRVTRPGGRLVVCEFSRPTWAPFRTVYAEYLMRALPPVARAVSKEPDAYVYLAESIREWPDQQGLGRLIKVAGWGQVAFRNLSGGIVALHRGVRPA